jgi:hypothetical protein
LKLNIKVKKYGKFVKSGYWRILKKKS